MSTPSGTDPDGLVITARAYPRAGILGNPSDLYGGRGIGFTFSDFHAEVRLVTAPDADPRAVGRSEIPLLRAAREILRRSGDGGAVDSGPFRMTYTTNIPRQAGLSGSSAIVVAALRVIAGYAWRRGIDLDLAPTRLADLALKAETEVLDQVAGPMDRVLQAHEGFLAMDFAHRSVERLSAAVFPDVVLLIDRNPGEASGAVHAPVRQRWEQGDPEVRTIMESFRPLVARGLEAVRSGDRDGLARCIDENFDLRRSVFPIEPRDGLMVERVRRVGAAAKFCGSGGALLVLPAVDGVDVVREVAEAAGWRFLRPTLVGAV